MLLSLITISVYFQLIAAPNRLKFWFQMGSIVDFCTIPPCALALILERNWLGESHTHSFN